MIRDDHFITVDNWPSGRQYKAYR